MIYLAMARFRFDAKTTFVALSNSFTNNQSCILKSGKTIAEDLSEYQQRFIKEKIYQPHMRYAIATYG